MGAWDFASRTTYVTFTTADENVKVMSGEPIRIWGIVYTKNGNSAQDDEYIEVRDGTGASGTLLQTVRVILRDTVVDDIPWIADQGLSFTVKSAAGDPTLMKITVFHSQLGS
jgi:hypothetical protein